MDLRVTYLVRVANTGLKVVGFSTSCALFVRVAEKGLRERQKSGKSAKRRRETTGSNEKSGTEEKIIAKHTTDLSNCQDIFYSEYYRSS